MSINALYGRTSTEDQYEKGTIEAQLIFADKYCDLHEIKLFEIYKDDGVTGTLPLQDRPDGARLLQDAKDKKFDVLLIYRLDRLGRSARVILNAVHELEQYGVKVKSMTEPFDTTTPAGNFLLTMLAGVADLERTTILDRLQGGANRAAGKGKWLGGIVPYGYKVIEKKLTINEALIPNTNISEASVIRLMYQLTVEHHMSTIEIADYFNSLHIPPSYVLHKNSIKKGKRKINTAGIWRPSRILNMLKSTVYKGIHVYGKRSKKERELIERKVPAIISEEVWDRAQEVIKENYIEAFRNRKYDYLLRSLVKCGSCGLNYHGTSNGKNSYYRCNGRDNTYKGPSQGLCENKTINAQWIEEFVWNDCLTFIHHPNVVIEHISEDKTKFLELKESIDLEINLLRKSIDDMEVEKERILDLFRKKLISFDDVEKQLTKIEIEKSTLNNRAIELESNLHRENVTTIQKSNIIDLLVKLKEKLIDDTEKIDFELKREIVKTLIDSIVVNTVQDENDNLDTTIQINYKFGVVNRTDKDS